MTVEKLVAILAAYHAQLRNAQVSPGLAAQLVMAMQSHLLSRNSLLFPDSD